MNMSKTNCRFKPFILSAVLVAVDQLTKYLVVENIEIGSIKYRWFNDFIWICHVRNTGVAFSIGDGLDSFFRLMLFIILPIIVLTLIALLIASKKSPLSCLQKYFVAGIFGGGIGTLIDRIFRFELGVVDFISVKFNGFFGLERWPTFNISDSCVVVFVILFALSVLFTKEE